MKRLERPIDAFNRRAVTAKPRITTGRLAALLAATLLWPAAAQQRFVDDAGREVTLPARIDKVFAAGAPAEVLLYTLVPDKLAGRNMTPSLAAAAFLTAEFRALPAIANLPDRDDPRYDAELLALGTDVYVDYGTIDEDYIGALEVIARRTRVAGVILDGRLTAIPSVYRRLGAALGVPERGAELAGEAQRLLDKYGGALAAEAPRVYLACSQNGLSPCYRGHSAGEAAELLGAANVAGDLEDAPRRPLTIAEVQALSPDVLIAANAEAAAAIRGDTSWRGVPAVAAGRVHAAPALPFNWGPRPPSVNRLLGVIWLAYVLPGKPFDDEFAAEVRGFFESFYRVPLRSEQLRELLEPRQ